MKLKKKLTFEINLGLINNGNTPADDIDIHLHFPDGFKLVETGNIKSKIEFPEPPYKPKNRMDIGFPSWLSVPSMSPIANVGNSIKFDSPTIKKTNSYDVHFNRKGLKHGYTEELKSLSIVFERHKDIKNFPIEYDISAGNIPNELIGKLNVTFGK
ncbi:MAG: hypothetical protein M3421_01120 [Bacteroidota bacterium]|nr:hypothetical protein [Bacteroidota bacterium]